jgi:hypothetical protein
MNATLFESGKVHRLAGSAARCGVGKGRPRCAWQMDLSGVTCLRCIRAAAVEQQSNEGTKVFTAAKTSVSLLTSAATP